MFWRTETPTRMKVLTEPLNDQQKQVMQLREQGLTHAQIGRAMGFSGTRAKEMVIEAQRRMQDIAKNGQDALCLLPALARQFLEAHGLTSRAEVRAAMDAGKLFWSEQWGRPSYGKLIYRSYGWGTWQVLCEWAGLPRPVSTKHRCVTCPHCGGKVPL